MFERHSASYAASGSRGSSWGSSCQERRHKRDEDRRYKREGEHSGLGEGLSQTYRPMSSASEHERCDWRD